MLLYFTVVKIYYWLYLVGLRVNRWRRVQRLATEFGAANTPFKVIQVHRVWYQSKGRTVSEM